MRVGPLVVVLMAGLAACAPSSVPAGDDPQPTAAVTVASAEPSATSTVAEPAPDLVFEPVDTGVAVAIGSSDELRGVDPAPSDPGGDRFEFTGCRMTWFGSFEFEFDWAAGDSRAGQATIREISVSLVVGDSGAGLPPFEVELSGPGGFVIPAARVDPFAHPSADQRVGDSRLIDSASQLWCLAQVGGPEPVAGESTMSSPLTIEVDPPRPIHPPDSIQGRVERLDPTDPAESLRPLAALAGVMAEFPVDIVYVDPNAILERLVWESDGACLVLESTYRGGTHLQQHAGCPDGRFDGRPIDGTWAIGGDVAVDDLIPLHWLGHPGVDVRGSPEEYLDHRNLPDGAVEVYRVVFDGIHISVVRHVSPSGTVVFELEGVGDTGGGGGFPGEMWNGCYQVQYQQAGYSMIVVADPLWIVSVGGEQIETTDVGGAAVTVVPWAVTSRNQIDIVAVDGTTPECVSSP